MTELQSVCLYATDEDFFRYLSLKAAEQRSDQITRQIAEQATEIAKQYQNGKQMHVDRIPGRRP